MCKNIDLFNKCCVAILGALYGQFPVPVMMKTDDAAALIVVCTATRGAA